MFIFHYLFYRKEKNALVIYTCVVHLCECVCIHYKYIYIYEMFCISKMKPLLRVIEWKIMKSPWDCVQNIFFFTLLYVIFFILATFIKINYGNFSLVY